MPLASQSPYPIMVYSVANYTDYRPHLSHFWTNFYFSRSQLSHFLFLWIGHFLNWMKNTLLFIYSTNILVRLLIVNPPTGFHATEAKHTRILVHSIFLHAQREGRVVIFRPHHLHRSSFDTTQFITTSMTSLFAGISDWSLSLPSGSLAIVSRLARKWR